MSIKFRELENGMAIHCKTQEEAEKLVQYYGMSSGFIEKWIVYKDETCYFYQPEIFPHNPWSYQDRVYALKNKDKFTLVEFEDLLIPEGPEKQEESKKPPRPSYIVCELTSGEVMDFNGYCNHFELWGANDDFVKFQSVDVFKGPLVNLAYVKVSEIKRIVCVSPEEKLMATVKNEEGENS